MKKITIILIGLLLIISSCNKENGKIEGTWINSDFTRPSFLNFTESHYISYAFGLDSFPYFLHQDSIFLQVPFKPELLKFDYKISGDTLWTSFPENIKAQNTVYFKSKSRHYFDDIKSHLGIKLHLPYGYSNIVGLRLGPSIYLPEQNATDGQYRIFANNKQFVLDSLFHEKLFKLREELNDSLPKYNLVGLYIDSNTKYGVVKLLKNELRKVGFYNVAFISNPSDEKYYETNIGLQKKLFPIFENEKNYINPDIKKIVDSRRPPPPKPPKEFYEEPDLQKSNVCKVVIIDNQILLNESKFSPDALYEKIKKNNPFFIYLNVDNGSNYETYYSFISTFDSIHKEFQNKKSFDLYKNEYDELIDYEKIKKVNSLCKSRLIEN